MTVNEIWPNFFIVGAPKAGTTSLYEYLQKIPSVYMSPVKEPFYFLPNSSLIPGGVRITDKEKYLNLFRDAIGYAAIGEASPAYLIHPDSARLIHDVVPYAKIIIILRDPIERAFSHYLMYLRYGESLPFIDAIEAEIVTQSKKPVPGELRRRYITQSLYTDNVKRYFDTFGKENVKVLIFEEFVQDTKGALQEILKFLNVDFQSIPDTVQEAHNPYLAVRSQTLARVLGRVYWAGEKYSVVSMILRTLLPLKGLIYRLTLKKYTKPKITPEERAFLENIFHDDIKKLSSLLGRPLPWEFSV
jgi:hypothetical protein